MDKKEPRPLSILRVEIDKIDSKLVALLNDRMEIVKEVGELKKHEKSAIYRPEREKEIVDRLNKSSAGLLNRNAIEAIFMEIFAISRNLELPEQISYLGPEGSFTHQAAESRFGAISKYMGLRTIESIFESVETGRSKYGVVPIENNQQGVVYETLDCLGQKDLKIVADFSMPIHFSFATKAEELGEIKKIYSKDIAFRQCGKFIRDTFGDNVELDAVTSTSLACTKALEEPDSAAICSTLATKLYDLPILFDNIQDSDQNRTRFVILCRDNENVQTMTDQTSILAKLAHSDEAGTLAQFLMSFEEAGVNLTRIESRPAKKGKDFNYQFFIDFDGHYLDENIAAVFKKHGKEIKWLGSYVK